MLGKEHVCFLTQVGACKGTGMEGDKCSLLCQWALTQRQTLESWFEGQTAYLSDCSVELPLRPSAIAAPPLGPSWFPSRLRGWGLEVKGEPCQWALTQRRTLGGGGALQRGQTALWETCSESQDPREVNHLYFSIAVGRLADRHFATLISHLGSALEGRALYLAFLDVPCPASQVVACETVWEQEHEREL